MKIFSPEYLGTNLYLFLIYRSAFPTNPMADGPRYERVGRVMTATWTDATNIYLLTGPNDEPTLRSYLQ